jgi:hypothetical protein
MAGHSRPKDGVLSHAYVPAIPIHLAKLCAPKRDHRDKPGDDGIALLVMAGLVPAMTLW